MTGWLLSSLLESFYLFPPYLPSLLSLPPPFSSSSSSFILLLLLFHSSSFLLLLLPSTVPSYIDFTCLVYLHNRYDEGCLEWRLSSRYLHIRPLPVRSWEPYMNPLLHLQPTLTLHAITFTLNLFVPFFPQDLWEFSRFPIFCTDHGETVHLLFKEEYCNYSFRGRVFFWRKSTVTPWCSVCDCLVCPFL